LEPTHLDKNGGERPNNRNHDNEQQAHGVAAKARAARTTPHFNAKQLAPGGKAPLVRVFSWLCNLFSLFKQEKGDVFFQKEGKTFCKPAASNDAVALPCSDAIHTVTAETTRGPHL
jgi:hypothetical protein